MLKCDTRTHRQTWRLKYRFILQVYLEIGSYTHFRSFFLKCYEHCHKGSLKNYVDHFLPYFDHLPTSSCQRSFWMPPKQIGLKWESFSWYHKYLWKLLSFYEYSPNLPEKFILDLQLLFRCWPEEVSDFIFSFFRASQVHPRCANTLDCLDRLWGVKELWY